MGSRLLPLLFEVVDAEPDLDFGSSEPPSKMTSFYNKRSEMR